jgi:hypothetical protein
VGVLIAVTETVDQESALKIIKGTVLPGVGAAVLLLSVLASGSSAAAPMSSPSSEENAGTSVVASGTSTAGGPEVRESAASTQALAVPVSVVTAVRDDGSVDFQVARYVRFAPNNRRAQAIDGLVHTAVLAPDAQFLSTMGCDINNQVPPSLDQQGLGTVPCDREAYLAMTPPGSPVAPAIFYNEAGQISKMANHYHP